MSLFCRSNVVATLIAGAVLTGAFSVQAADTVYLKGSGNERKTGTITSETATELVVTSGVGSLKKTYKIPANEVDRVDFEEEPLRLQIVRGNEGQGKLDDALAGYQEMLGEVKPDNEIVRTDIEFLIGRTLAKMAKADPSKIDEAITKLEAFQTAHPNSFRYFPATSWLADLYIAKGDGVKADATLSKLANSPWEDYKMSAKISQGRLLLKQNQIPQAQAQFQAVVDANATSDIEKARRFEAMLGLATTLQRQNQADAAAKMLTEVIDQAATDDTKTLAEAFLRKGDTLLASGKKKDALIAYLHVDVLFNQEKDLHAEALYRLSSLWNEVGKPERAADSRAQLGSLYGNSEWAKKLAGGS
ncbi:tetratricopeptide repeat protein [Thalassoroseus pseudoceratinae]|uniref:tetratricopeptide repeat protein n=1 Tax=Thalassoroseus pseudoceratinae TaxID=2713176 RepID=UPI00141F276C|nr:tetratricopeptide repeat protein [Thalassoroseus pseudoceratinae]